MALPKKLSLTINREVFWRLKREGKVIQTPLLSAKYYLRKTGAESRASVVIGTAMDKRATVRNRLKRLIHQALILFLPKRTGIDMIIYPKKGIIEADREMVKREVGFLLKKASGNDLSL
ncbi:ribonuclease P protein component [Candidatus Microgenomates bacterium]|nr:ribonuclease P protein component [Candidatus Microgenomates bacterium]